MIISSQAEDELLASLRTTRHWIGLTDVVVEQTFVWVDGSLLVYEQWASNEPNSDSQDCTEMIELSSNWNEEDCLSLRASFCER